MSDLENVSFDAICRTCLSKDKDISPLQEVKLFCDVLKRKLSLVEMFEKYTALKISEDDDKPQKICGGCINSLCQSYNFFEQCIESNRLLDRVLEKKKALEESSDDEFNDNASSDADYEPDVKVEVKCELNDKEDMENDDEDDEDEDDKKDFDDAVRRTRSLELDDGKVCPLCKKTYRHISRHLEIFHMVEITENKCLKCNVKLDSETELTKHIKTGQHKSLSCMYCKTQFNSMKNCYTHQQTCSENKSDKYTCKMCSKSFKLFEEIFKHFNEEHKAEQTCIIPGCKKKGRDEYQHWKVLQYHIQVQHGKRIGCRHCFVAFDTKDGFKEHCKTNEHKNICDICGRKLKNKPRYNTHKLSHETHRYRCDQCPATYMRLTNLKRHIERDHEGHRFLCPQCGKNFSLKHTLEWHIKTVHGEVKKYKCKECGVLVCGDEDIEEHKRLHEIGGHVCLKCKKTFESDEELKKHFETHNKVKCDTCGELFIYLVQLNNHIKAVHELQNPLSKPPRKRRSKADGPNPNRPKPNPNKYRHCTRCEQDFPTTHDYFMHVKEHKDFRCGQCHKSFTNKYLYQRHVRTHTEGFQFKCEFCGKGFERKQDIVKHRHIHTGQKPFLCNICGKAFRQTAHLKSHLKSHMGTRTYKCQYCAKAFVQYTTWICHERIHTGEKPYVCSVCNKGFNHSSTMKKHQATHSKGTAANNVNNSAVNASGAEQRRPCGMPQICQNYTTTFDMMRGMVMESEESS